MCNCVLPVLASSTIVHLVDYCVSRQVLDGDTLSALCSSKSSDDHGEIVIERLVHDHRRVRSLNACFSAITPGSQEQQARLSNPAGCAIAHNIHNACSLGETMYLAFSVRQRHVCAPCWLCTCRFPEVCMPNRPSQTHIHAHGSLRRVLSSDPCRSESIPARSCLERTQSLFNILSTNSTSGPQ